MINTFKIEGLSSKGFRTPATGLTVTVHAFSVGDMPYQTPNGSLIDTCSEISGTGEYTVDLAASQRITVAVNDKAIPGRIGILSNGNVGLDNWVDTSAIQDGAVTPTKASFVIISENDFTAANGTALTTYDADWTIDSGSAEIQSNKLDVTGTPFRAWKEASEADVQITATMRVTSGSGWNAGIMFRRQDANNYLVCDLVQPGTIRIYRVVGGIPAGISQQSYTVSNGVDYQLTVTAVGSSLQFQVYNGSVFGNVSKTDANFQTQTKHGLYSGIATALFDDFVISNLF